MPAPTSNITGTFKSSSGTVRVGTSVIFEPLGAPFALDGDIITSPRVAATTDANGQIGINPVVTLVQGSYRVIVSDLDAFIILVPGDGLTHNLDDLTSDLGSGGTGSGNTGSGLSIAALDLTIDDTTTISSSRVGDIHEPPISIAFFGEGVFSPLGTGLMLPMLEQVVPTHIVALGNMNPSGTPTNIDANIGQWFHSRINPYNGGYGAGGETNTFWYAPGSEDWVHGDLDELMTTYFERNRYYKAVLKAGVCAVFVIDSNDLEPDGNEYNSTQAVWLQNQLSTATEQWKIVAFRDAPYCSKTGYDFLVMDWPFEQWGADLVVAGGARFLEWIQPHSGSPPSFSGIPLLIAGGNWEDGAADTGTLIDNSVWRDNTTPGIWLITLNSYSMKLSVVYNVGTVGDLSTLPTEIVGSPGPTLKPVTRLSPTGGSGLVVDWWSGQNLGLTTDFGGAPNQIIGGIDTNDVWWRLREGRLLRLDTIPSIGDTKAQPWLKNCIVVVGDDPPTGFFYWNRANETWCNLVLPASLGTDNEYGSRTTCTSPIFDPPEGEVFRFKMTVDSGDHVWVSINGSVFNECTDPFNDVMWLPKQDTSLKRIWVAAYASNPTKYASPIVTAYYRRPW